MTTSTSTTTAAGTSGCESADAADAALDKDDVRKAAEQIRQAYHALLAQPEALAPGYDEVVTLHALRACLPLIPRGVTDAALRYLDHHLIAEVSEAADPTPQDEAAAVWTSWGPEEDEQGWQHHFALVTPGE